MPRTLPPSRHAPTHPLAEEVARLHDELLDAELRLLRAQLHPHFLFNALGAIQELMASDPALAERMTGTLVELLRLSFANAGRAEVPLDTELAFVSAYLALERLRFEERLDAVVDATPEARACRVPNMLLQPLVENAVRHGIARRARGGAVAVRARRAGDVLRITVEDDGVGFAAPRAPDAPAREGVGLSSARRRLARLFGARHTFAVRARPTGGVCVEIEIPCIEP